MSAICLEYLKSLDNITRMNTLDLETAVDNIQMDPTDDSLWLGCQPSAWNSLQYLKSPDTMIAPSHVLKVKVDKEGNPTEDITEIYRNKGEQISMSTVALHYQRKTLIGSVYHNMVHCEIQN